MDSPESDITFPVSGSRLLSESPILPSSSDTGPGGDDLSISDLSFNLKFDRTAIFQNPLALLRPEPLTPTRGNERDDDLHADTDAGPKTGAEKTEQEKRQAAKLREEKLQSDIFILKKLNTSFALFNEVLQDTGSANQVRSLCIYIYITFYTGS